MFESALAENCYAQSEQHTGTSRSIEYRLFSRITRQLEAAKTPAIDRFVKLAQAVYDNERLWTTLAADVAHEENQLPAELRSKIFYLFEFTRSHSRKVMQGLADPDILVEINTAIMRGLKGSAEPQETAS